MPFQKGHTLGKLKPGQWSKKYPCCQKCGTTEIPHVANGLCKKCYYDGFIRPRQKEYNRRKKKYQHERYINNRHKHWAKSTLYKHKLRKFAINITIDELEILAKHTKICPLCGKILNWHNNSLKDDSPTLDRKNNEKILTKDNIWILCYKCNTIKNSLTLLELKKWCELIAPKIEQYL